MTTLDLFGDPVDDQPPTPAHPAAPAAPLTNDMDLVASVLADVLDEKTAPLHHDDTGAIRRCGPHETTPVADDTAVVVRQLVAARYLTPVRRRSCTTPAHGPEIAATPTGRGAVCRWQAYRRPTTWGPATNRSDTGPTGERGDNR